jgi:iron(III) transport system ATP-binding protein
MSADNLILMAQGRIPHAGSPETCYLKPVSPEAARLLGETINFPVKVANGDVRTPFGILATQGTADGPGVATARPKAFRLHVTCG